MKRSLQVESFLDPIFTGGAATCSSQGLVACASGSVIKVRCASRSWPAAEAAATDSKCSQLSCTQTFSSSAGHKPSSWQSKVFHWSKLLTQSAKLACQAACSTISTFLSLGAG